MWNIHTKVEINEETKVAEVILCNKNNFMNSLWFDEIFQIFHDIDKDEKVVCGINDFQKK